MENKLWFLSDYTFLWNYDHFPFQEVIEFLVGKDAVLGKSWNAISSLATFAGASSVILLKLHWSAAETLHTTKRGPLKCSRRYMATKRPVFWFFFHNLPKKLENLLLFSSLSITCISCSIWVFTLRAYSPAQYLQVLWQYSQILDLQVTTFFKYWVNTRKFYHNTYEYCHIPCEYWAGEYTLSIK